MSNLIVKEFNGSKIHTFMWNNKPCWIANEIVSIFDYADPSKTIQQCIKAEEFEIGVEYDILKGNDLKTFKEFVSKVTTVEVVTQLKYVPQLTIFYEDGMYGFLQYTDKPIGVAFRKWLRREVLPEIRKTGKYIRSKEDATQSNQYWFIKWYKGRPIITLHDFKKLTGIELSGRKPFFREEYFTAGYDWNGLGQGPLREEFERLNNVHYEEETFLYLLAPGVKKALRILLNDKKINISTDTVKTIKDSLYKVESGMKNSLIQIGNKMEGENKKIIPTKRLPIQINIVLNEEMAINNY